MNKRAQAQIITTVLIILLVLAAVVIVWQVISATVKEGAKEAGGTGNCFLTQLDIRAFKLPSCDNETEVCQADETTCTDVGCNGNWIPAELVVRRTAAGPDVVGFRILINGTLVDERGTGNLGPLGTERVDIDLTSSDVIKVEVALVMNPGEEDEKLCEPSAELKP